MTSSQDKSIGEPIAEFVLPEGCVSCGGAVNIRSTPSGGAHSYCPQCHWLSRTRLRMRKEGLEIAFATKAAA